MHFEHLVQVNDPHNPLVPDLTREQLWRGLVRRAEEPVSFVYGLRGAEVLLREEMERLTVLTRTLDFGSVTVVDRVRLYPMERTEIHAVPSPDWPPGRLVIRIEEPLPDHLFLRFTYELRGEEEGERALDVATHALRRQAYKRADIDTVGRIRQLAKAGELD